MEEKLNKGREVISKKIDLPKEVILDVPKVIITGNKEVTIENHKGIISFDKDELKINSRIGAVQINGKGFEILYIGESTIVISGTIKSIVYEEVEV